eukprot:TRINITY_DN24401_c0_g1_i1.p1 TRINITY_DN24401_c0_g1~~TRINITY_DN24401_c0_g1_i1.p1  ORF type:complete len:347 (-),score=107.94 TRINITY_DN24401_c0_g1_i1:115-1155(-)
MMYGLLLAVIFIFGQSAIATQVTISNVLPRKDTDGVIMDIHDGNTLLINGTYYYYGASYGLCKEPAGPNGCADAGTGTCGFQLDHNVSLYTSTDMATWTNQGHVFQMASSGITAILFCPKVLYNKLNNNFVLWFNWVADGFAVSMYGVAVSPTPYGPFKVVSTNVSTLAYANTGDFSLFVDDDGQAYVIYTAHIVGYTPNHRMSVERLTPDYIATVGSSGNSGFFGNTFVEAPALFKRNGIYYAVFGQCCCYCQGGGNVIVHSATSPLGPYAELNAISGAIPSQQTSITGVQLADGSYTYLWQGDRWQSAPDGLKGHDFSYWGPLQFDASGNVSVLAWQDSFTLAF